MMNELGVAAWLLAWSGALEREPTSVGSRREGAAVLQQAGRAPGEHGIFIDFTGGGVVLRREGVTHSLGVAHLSGLGPRGYGPSAPTRAARRGGAPR